MTKNLGAEQRKKNSELYEIALSEKDVTLVDSADPDNLRVEEGKLVYLCLGNSPRYPGNFGFYHVFQGNYRLVFKKDLEDVRNIGEEFVIKINSYKRRTKRKHGGCLA